jgi:RNA polymerase sigma factor FliA
MNYRANSRAGVVAAEADTRERSVEAHLGLVHNIARTIHQARPFDAELDELVSAGTIGLMQALESFDPGRGLAFSTFASPRIRGAIQDELRRLDHVPRSVREKARDIARAREQLARILGRAPQDTEVAEHLGVPLETYDRWRVDTGAATSVSLSAAPEPDSPQPRVSLEQALADEESTPIEDRLNLAEEVELLKDALLALKEQERVVLALYYYEELKLHEIAQVLGVTESRVSQIRSKAISKLRAELAPLRMAT